MVIPLEILDREVARAASALTEARIRLARAPLDDLADAPSPLEAHRRVSTRATFAELGEVVGPGATLAAPLRAWIHALTLDRVLWRDEVRRAAAWRAPTISVGETGIAPFTDSPRALLLRMLREPDAARRRVLASALARGAGAVHDAARVLAERRAEASRLLGAAPDHLEIPVDPPAALGALACRFLTDTAALLPSHASWSAALSSATGSAFGEGWPAHLTPRWLHDLFGKSTLTEGLRLSIDNLPAPLGASSFARALGAFGAALADADGPRASFALSRAPFDLRRTRRSALFAALAADPVFATRALGLGRGRARDQARGVATALCLALRIEAARVLCRGALSLPDGERASRFEEHTAVALGVPIPAALAGVVPRLGPADAVSFAGALLAASDRRTLVERFDEDWFASPHAALAIREEDSEVMPPVAPEAALERGLAEVVRALGEIA